jgi:hypothetical protein
MGRVFLILAALAAPLGVGVNQASADHLVVNVAPPAPREVVPEYRHGYDAWDSYDGYSYDGNVWVQGHWSWNGYTWVWNEGYWTEARPGYVWVDGYWGARGYGEWYWTPGNWQRIRTGHHWRPGRWTRVGNRWDWTQGSWIRARAGYDWEPGRWTRYNGRVVWNDGRWRDQYRRRHYQDYRRPVVHDHRYDRDPRPVRYEHWRRDGRDGRYDRRDDRRYDRHDRRYDRRDDRRDHRDDRHEHWRDRHDGRRL